MQLSVQKTPRLLLINDPLWKCHSSLWDPSVTQDTSSVLPNSFYLLIHILLFSIFDFQNIFFSPLKWKVFFVVPCFFVCIRHKHSRFHSSETRSIPISIINVKFYIFLHGAFISRLLCAYNPGFELTWHVWYSLKALKVFYSLTMQEIFEI